MKKPMLMVTLAMGAATSLFAESILWSAGSGNVNEPANWTPQRVPGSSDTANVKSGTASASGDFSVGKLAIASDHDYDEAKFVQSAGTVTVGNSGTPLVLAENGHAIGRYALNGGKLVIPGGQPRWGNWGLGILHMTAGECVSSGTWPSLGGSANGSVTGAGVLDISGGTFTQNETSSFFCLGEHGYGLLSVSGTGVFKSGIRVGFGIYDNAVGHAVVQRGGTFEALDAYAGNSSGAKTAHFSDGTFRPCGKSEVAKGLFSGVQMSVGAGGITVDTAGKSVSFASPILDGIGNLRAANLAHRWSFTAGSLADSVGTLALAKAGSNVAGITFADGQVTLPGGNHNSARLVTPIGFFPNSEKGVTLEFWATLHKQTKNYDRVFSINQDWKDSWSSKKVSLCWSTSNDPDDYLQAAWGTWADQTAWQVVANSTAQHKLDCEEHIAVVFAPSGSSWLLQVHRYDPETGLFVKAKELTVSNASWTPGSFSDTLLALGYSFDTTNPDAQASYNEVRVWKTALTKADLDRSAMLGPDADFTERASLVKTGEGVLSLPTGNTYAGATEVRQGTLALGAVATPHRRWSFTDGSLKDSVASASMSAVGSLSYVDGRVVLPGATHEKAYIGASSIFPDCSETDGVTLEFYATLDRMLSWQRLFTIYTDGVGTGLSATWGWETAPNGDLYGFRTSWTDMNVLNVLADGAMAWVPGTEYHVALVFKKTASGFDMVAERRDATSGAVLKSGSAKVTWTPAKLAAMTLRLGWSWDDSSDAAGKFDEVRVWNRALTSDELTAGVKAGRDRLPTFPAGTAAASLPSTADLKICADADVALCGAAQTVRGVTLDGTLVGPGCLTATDGISLGGAAALAGGAALTGDVKLKFAADGSCGCLTLEPGRTYDLSTVRIVPSDDAVMTAVRYVVAKCAGATVAQLPALASPALDGWKLKLEANGNLVLRRRTGMTVIFR